MNVYDSWWIRVYFARRYTHTNTHINTHTYKHTHAQTHSHTYTHIHIHTFTLTVADYHNELLSCTGAQTTMVSNNVVVNSRIELP